VSKPRLLIFIVAYFAERTIEKVVKATPQARFQEFNLFYDRRFDCAPVQSGGRYPATLDFV